MAHSSPKSWNERFLCVDSRPFSLSGVVCTANASVPALCAHRNQHILFSASRLWRVPVRSHLKHLAAPSASLAVTDPREMSILTPQGARRRSTFYDEDLGEVVDLSEHGTWANANLCEIIQDLVDALFPLQAMSDGHEQRFAALGAVQKTAKGGASDETQRNTEQTREFTCRCLKMPRKNLDIRCPTVPNVFAGSTLLFRATTKLNGLQVCLGGCRPWKHHSPAA